mmetsp:Transcript_23671/g.51675  ORF Transcript_23671/g.51675 Transcript_23671/m.51675 type:complete len:203 (-) Transcript_23671:230-838(-)
MAFATTGVFATVVQKAIESQDFGSISTICDEYELQLGGSAAVPDWPYNLHMIGYLINNDLESARFLWKRIPQIQKEGSPELEALWRLTQAMWTRNYPLTHASLHSGKWSSECTGAVAYLAESIRERSIALLSKAYTTISLTDCAVVIGASEDITLKYMEQAGWQIDPATKMLTVRQREEEEENQTGYKQLQQLTEYVVHLEG